MSSQTSIRRSGALIAFTVKLRFFIETNRTKSCLFQAKRVILVIDVLMNGSSAGSNISAVPDS